MFVLHYLLFVYREGFPWPNNSAAFRLVQPKPAPILKWQLNEWARVTFSVKQFYRWVDHTVSQHLDIEVLLTGYTGWKLGWSEGYKAQNCLQKNCNIGFLFVWFVLLVEWQECMPMEETHLIVIDSLLSVFSQEWVLPMTIIKLNLAKLSQMTVN